MAIIKHTAKPATAEEIRRAVGVTEEDRKAVDSMLKELGYASDSPTTAKTPARRTAVRAKPAKAKKAVRGAKGARTSSKARVAKTPAGAKPKKSVAIVKYSYTPATAEEILSAVGVTEEDRKIVEEVLAKLRQTGRPPAAAKKTRPTSEDSASRKTSE